MLMFKKGQFNAWLVEKIVLEEAPLIYRNFNVFVPKVLTFRLSTLLPPTFATAPSQKPSNLIRI